jgi:hypothetical protein
VAPVTVLVTVGTKRRVDCPSMDFSSPTSAPDAEYSVIGSVLLVSFPNVENLSISC